MKLCQYEGCRAYTENPNGDYCGTHGAMIRKQARLAARPQKVVKRIAKQSPKKKEQLKLYVPKKKAYLIENPNCQIKIAGICTGKATTIHHCSMSDLDFLNVETWRGGCFECHVYLEQFLSAAERRDLGLLV